MINGVLLLHKKSGKSSHNLVHSIRKIIGQKAVGHGGTLDPMAEGLMLILLGEGTKLSDYLLFNDKSYRLTFRLGITTDTLDKTGSIITSQAVYVDKENIEKCVKSIQGELLLPVPLCSAVKVKGKKLYQYMRQNKPVSVPYRKMFFYDLKIINMGSDWGEVEISCRKGSYIRSWVSLIGQKLNTGACLEKLVRLKSNPFKLESALTLEEVRKKFQENKGLFTKSLLQDLKPAFIPLSSALPHIQPVLVPEKESKHLSQGWRSHDFLSCLKEEQKQVNLKQQSQKIRVMCQSRLVALCELKPFQAPQVLRVFLRNM